MILCRKSIDRGAGISSDFLILVVSLRLPNRSLLKQEPLYEAGDPWVVACLQELQIDSLVSLVTLDGKDSICLFSAVTAEDVRSFYRKLNQPFKHSGKPAYFTPSRIERCSEAESSLVG